MRLLLLLTSIDALRYSVVLPSSKRLHKDAVRALQRGVRPINERDVGPSRLVFDAAADAPDRRDWRRLLRGPLSVRVVAAEAAVVDVGPDADAGGAADAIVDAIDGAVDWDAALGAWAAFGNAAGPTLSAHVRCQRFRSATWCPAGASPPLRRALARRLPARLFPEHDRAAAAVEVQVTVHAAGVLVELVALRQYADRSLPDPGMKRVESFVVARSAEIQAGDVVVDPFCGRGSFLVEAGVFRPDASYVGVDLDEAQLAAARRNAAATGVDARFERASALDLPLADGSVDAVLSCPPFDRQFAAGDEGLEALYAGAFREMARVLRPGTGRAVLLLPRAAVPDDAAAWFERLSDGRLFPAEVCEMCLTKHVTCVLVYCALDSARATPRGFSYRRSDAARQRVAALPELELAHPSS